jgi:flagellar biosynthetic protein FliQ
MSVDVISDITNRALFLIIEVSLPVLLVSLVIGLLVSIFQTVTSIQEQTLTFIPKIIGVFVTLMILGPWMMNTIIEYTNDLWLNFETYVKG